MGDKRFKTVEKQGISLACSSNIITDTETGVQYLFVREGYGGGVTVLVDEDGKPLIDEQYRRKK